MAESSQRTDMVVSGSSAALEETSQLDAGESKASPLSRFGNIDILRQVTLILALAICLALAVFILIWGKQPEMRPLGEMTTPELVEVLDFLDQQQIEYQIDSNTVKVRADQYEDIRLQMTRAGLSKPEAAGDDILLKDMGFGVSQRLEGERLKLSREKQLARAISELKNVSAAHVLLAIPKTNVFSKRDQRASATVVVNLRRAGGLSQEETDSIVDMVASAVPNLDPSRVTVTDQNGRLLNSGSQDPLASRTRREYEIEKSREQEYRNKIDAILIPVLGLGNYTAEVDVTMDFTAVEQTQKTFNPDLPALRSELTVENLNGGQGATGIPGALSNQPPMESAIPEDVTAGGEESVNPPSGSSHREATRNYELDTTVSHTRQQTGVIRRLSVSVAVDYVAGSGEAGERQPRSQQALSSIKRLLQGGIGFDVTRGDALEVVSIPFNRPDFALEEELPFWEADWFWRMMRILASMLVILILILVVIRPMLRRIMDPRGVKDNSAELDNENAFSGFDDDENLQLLSASEEEQQQVGISNGQLRLPDLHKDEDLLKAIRALVANEPELAAQVVKDWVTQDA